MEKTLTEIFYRRTVSKQRRIVNRFDGHLDGIINEWRNDASAPLGRGPAYLAWDSVANRRSLGSRFVDRVGEELEKDGKTVGTKKVAERSYDLFIFSSLPSNVFFLSNAFCDKGIGLARANWNKRIEVDDRCFSRLILPSPRLIDRVAIVPSRERERKRRTLFCKRKKEDKRKEKKTILDI